MAGKNVAPAFNSFLDQPGVPEISVALKCGTKPALELAQKRSLPIGSQAQPQIWEIPVCVAYEAGGAVHHQCSVLAAAKADMELAEARTCPAWLLPNDGEAGYYLSLIHI